MLVQRSQVGSVIGRGGYKIKETREVLRLWLEPFIVDRQFYREGPLGRSVAVIFFLS